MLDMVCGSKGRSAAGWMAAVVIVVLGLIAGFAAAVWIGADSVYAAVEKATVGYFENSAVKRDDSINLGKVDLAKVKENEYVTYRVAIQFEKEHTIPYEGAYVTDEKPAAGTYSVKDAVNFTNRHQVAFTVRFDPTYLAAGKYTANLEVPLDSEVNANGGKYKCVKDGDGYNLIIPVSIELTGSNPRFAPAVKTLSAEAWNSAVSISWAAPDDSVTDYTVYRREGKDASQSNPDLDKYKTLGYVSTAPSENWNSEPGFGTTSFTDYYAENGKTYSYIVISGGGYSQYEGNPSKAVTATPKASLRKRPAAPYWLGLKSVDEGIGLSWSWNEKGGQKDPEDSGCEPENITGEGEVDHFNVYQNGRLVKQVQQQAVEVTESYNGYTNASFSTRVKVKEYDVPYTFYVTAVAPDGTESAQSKRVTGIMEEEKDLEIWSANIFYTSEDIYDKQDDSKLITTYTGFDLQLDGRGINYYNVWRKAAGADDTTYKKINLISTPQNKEMDTGVKKGKVYTYKIIGVASDGQETDPFYMTVAADEGSWQGAPGGTTIEVSLRTFDGESALVRFRAYLDGTYKLYRDGKVLKTWKKPEAEIEYKDALTEDGKYEYYVVWTSTKYPEATITSNKILFDRNTSDPDFESFDKAPGKPKLNGRVQGYSESNWLQMMWSPSKDGGTPDGYVIYRTDGGVPNTTDWDCSLSWYNPKRNDGETANGRYWCTYGYVDRYDMYDFESDNDDETDGLNPHRIWIVAYNEVGYSEPSNVLEYVSTDDGLLPWDTDDSAPGAPEDVTAACEWTPGKYSYDKLDLTGRLNVTWSAPASGGDVDHYEIEVYHPGYKEDNFTVSENTEKIKVEFGREQKCSVTLWYYYVGLPFTVTVKAVNTKGETAAEPVTTVISSKPAIQAETADKNSVKLSWKGLLGQEKDTVKEFRFYRRANSSSWKVVRTIPYGVPGPGDDWTFDEYSGYAYTDKGLEGSTTYEYYVDAVDKDGKSHKSDVTSATLSDLDAALDAPKNLKAKVIDGDVILSWTPSLAGGIPASYILEYQLASEDPEEGFWYSTYLTESFGPSTGAAVTSMNLNSYYDEISSMIQEYGGKKLRLRVQARPSKTVIRDWSEYSNTIEITWPTEDEIKHQKYPPEPITPEAEAGDNKVTLRWKKRTKLDKEESEASYYQVVKTWKDKSVGETYGVVATFPADKDEYEWVDTDVVNGEKYTYELRPCSSYYYSYYSNKWWYHPWCYMHQVDVIPNGKTNEQKAAENIAAFADELLAAKPASMDDITDEYHDKVAELRDSYAGTSSYQRRLIGKDKCAEIEGLLNEVMYHDNEVKYAGDSRLLAAVDAINALDKYPADIGLDDQGFSDYEKAVKDAREAYDDLPDGAKMLVSSIDKLKDHESYIKKLKRDAANRAKADDLSDRMEALDPESITPETLTDELEREIRDLRYEYDSMTKAQKALVSEHALSNLEEAEAKAGMAHSSDDPSGDDPSGDDPSGDDPSGDDPPAEGAYMVLTPATYKWNGKMKTPAATVFYNGEAVDPSEYILTMPAGRKDVGVYTVSALLMIENAGMAEADFRINPKGTSISGVKSAKKAFTVKWKKQKAKMSKARVTGYQIQYSTDRKFKKNSRTLTVKGWKKTSRKVTGLKAKKTYFVRVRTYMKAGGKKLKSAWSKKKKVRTK